MKGYSIALIYSSLLCTNFPLLMRNIGNVLILVNKSDKKFIIFFRMGEFTRMNDISIYKWTISIKYQMNFKISKGKCGFFSCDYFSL